MKKWRTQNLENKMAREQYACLPAAGPLLRTPLPPST
jgi:hypothetical protein